MGKPSSIREFEVRRRLIAVALVIAILLAGVAVTLPREVKAETFGAPNRRVDDSLADGTNQFQPALATFGASTAYIAYTDDTFGDNDILLVRSTDGGRTWTPSPFALVDDDLPGSGDAQMRPDIGVASNGTIYVVWQDNRLGQFNVFVSWSTDGGVTWGDGLPTNDIRVDDSTAVADQPTIAINATGNLTVAWRDTRLGNQDIFAAYSADGGMTWSAGVRVNDDATAVNQDSPSAASAGDLFHVVWRDRRNDGGDVMHSRFSGTWSANVRVDDDATFSRARDATILAGLGGNPDALGVVFADDRIPGEEDIFFVGSSDGGLTWGDGLPNTDVRANDDTVGGNVARWPAIAEAGGRLVVAWADDRATGADFDVFATSSLDYGATWGDGVPDNDARVNDDEVGNGIDQAPNPDRTALAPLGTGVLAAWLDQREGDDDVMVSWSSNGVVWGDGYRNDNDVVAAGWGTWNGVDGGQQSEPQLVDYGSMLYSVWTDSRDDVNAAGDNNIYFSNSSDAGTTWGDGVLNNNDLRVDDGTGGANANSPDMAIDPFGRIFVIYNDDRNGNWDVFLTWSDDGGQTWGDGDINANDVRVDDGPGGTGQFEPAIAVDESGVAYAVWEDARTGGNGIDIRLSRSLDRGQTWSASVRVNDDVGGANQLVPFVVANATSVAAAWADARNGDNDVYFSRSLDGGVTWMPNVRVNDDLAGPAQFRPVLATSTVGVLTAAWQDSRLGASTNIFSAASLDGGATWSPNMQVNDPAPVITAVMPSLAADSVAYAAWQDTRGGNTDIWFSKFTTGPTWTTPNDQVNDPGSVPAVQATSEAMIDRAGVGVAWSDDRLTGGSPNIWFSRASRLEPSNGTLDRVLIMPWPGPVVLSNGQIQSYTAVAYDTDGNLNTTWTAVWGNTNGLGTVTPVGGSAQSGFTATYLAGATPGTDNITVDALGFAVSNQSLIQIVSPPPPPLARVEIAPWPGPSLTLPTGVLPYAATGYNSDNSLNMTWTPVWGTTNGLGVAAPTGAYTADYIAGTVAGIDNVTVVAAGFPNIANQSEIQIVVGPLSYLTITPWPGPTVIQVTQTTSYVAFGYDAWGNLNTSWTPVWGVTNGLGTATGTGGTAATGYTADYVAGLFTGVDNITVAAQGFIGTANQSMLVLEPGPIASIWIIPWPGPVIIPTLGVASYTAWAFDAYSNANLTWTPAWGTTNALGTATGTGGNPIAGFTADYVAGAVPGIDNITVADATVLGISNQSRIDIVAAPGNDPLVRIEIAPWPGPVTLTPTAASGFTALGYSQSGLQNTTWTATWAAGPLGSITATGGNPSTGFTATYTAGTLTGADTITVSNGTVSNATAITIVAGTVFRIELAPWPGPILLQPNQLQNFTVIGYDAWNNVNTTWADSWAPLNALGTATPGPGYTATFTAGTVTGNSGTTVSAVGVPGVGNSTAVVIEPGPLFRIDVVPPGSLTLNVGTGQSFTAWGYDFWGNLNTTWNASWSAVNFLGTLSGLGGNPIAGYTATYTAAVVGPDILRVANGTVLTDVAINNTAPAGPVSRIELTPWPGPVILNPLTAQGFTAFGYDSAGTLNTSWSAVWNTTDALGSANPTGGSAAIGFTADYAAFAAPGMDNITVAVNGTPSVSNQTQILIVVSAALARIELTPWPAVTVNLTTPQTFTALGYDAAGNLNASWTPTWAATPAIGSITPTGGSASTGWTATFTPSALGSGAVTVSEGVTAIANSTSLQVVDDVPPVSAIDPLPAYTRTLTFSLGFTASDSGGSGLNHTEIWFRVNGGGYLRYQNATGSPVTFTAAGDGRYDFYSVAVDNATNMEAAPPIYDATTVVDTAAPTLLASTPLDGATDIPVTAGITFRFSEDMNRTSVQAGVTVTVGGLVVPGTWSWSGDNATFVPNQPLLEGSTVTVTLTAATDAAGNPLASGTTFTFTTAREATLPPPNNLWLILLVLAVLLILVLLFALLRRKKEEPEEKPGEPAEKAGPGGTPAEEEIPPPEQELPFTEETPPPEEEPRPGDPGERP
ncbi:MAG TPA: exo-alpha-sialidase [Thermoplasmata archaeon]|nr:exo-alpha-sialidase [Thermoplasmata archaeon]